MPKARRHPLRLLLRLAYLLTRRPNPTREYVTQSYDRLSEGYDEAWTSHMRHLSMLLVNQLAPKAGSETLDLTCGTGFVTQLLAQKTRELARGVDRSAGMIAQAQQNYGDTCRFVQEDILTYLKTRPTNSFDIVTCAWGLGYSYPLAVLRQIKRVLKPGGEVAIIDNSLFSLAEIMHCSILTFMEQPQALERLMRFRFLTGTNHLRLWFRLAGLQPRYINHGKHSYEVKSGQEAVAKMRATGAAAGFEYATDPDRTEAIYDRFAQILEQRYQKDSIMRITHRYMMGIARA